MSATNNGHLLEWHDCVAVLRWSNHELSVLANLTCDDRAQIEIVVPNIPITARLLDFHAFFIAQVSAGGCSIDLESVSGQSARSNHVFVSSCNIGEDTAEVRLLCYELLVKTPSGPERSDQYKYSVRGLLCSGRFPVTAEFDFGKVSILGPLEEGEHGRPSWGEIWVKPNYGLTADEVDSGVNRVLDILSFAAGRSLRCSSRTRHVDVNVEDRIRPHGDLPPSRWPPFHHRNLTPIVATASRTYTDSLRKDTGVAVAIQWSAAHSTYASVRFVQLMIALEHLVHAAGSRVALFPKQVFKELSNRISQTIDEFRRTNEGERYRAECDALLQSVSHLNQRAFKKQIRRLLECYRVPLDGIEEHIDDLVDLRNTLVHRGVEPTEPERPVIEHELILRELVTRTVLAILEFEGKYQSWHDGKPRVATFSRIPDQGQAPLVPA